MLTDEDAKRNLAGNLQRLMENRGINQSDLARLTGEPVMTISRAFRGENMPRASVLARIAEAMDVSIDRLLGKPPEFSQSPP